MFIGRQPEIKIFSDIITQKKASFLTVQGRRRIGKSTFIKHCAQKFKLPLFEFVGLPPQKGITASDQLKHFSKTLAKYLGLKSLELSDWQEGFAMLDQLKYQKRSIVLLDEISWMAQGESKFAGYLKEAWDRLLANNKHLILVLCGSVSSWIQENILESTAFVGRTSKNFYLQELSLGESAALLQYYNRKITTVEIIKCLSIMGGVPRYLEEIKLRGSIEQTLNGLLFNPSAFLFNEFEQIFSEVFGERNEIYKKILFGIKDNASEPQTLADKLKVPMNGSFVRYLTNLELSSFIKRDFTWSFSKQSSGRKSRLRIKDNYLRFYLKYIEPKKEKIKKLPHLQTENFNWPQIFGLQLENTVVNHIESILPKLDIDPYEIINLGPYFQPATKNQAGVQIDCLIQTKYKVLHIIECKSGDYVSREVLKELHEKIKRLRIPRGFSVRCHIVYVGLLSNEVRQDEFIDRRISIEELV